MIPNPERPVSVIVGLNRGDEGKGRFTDMWAEHYDMIARYAGGANAGHQIVFEGKEIALHQIPSGIAWPNKMNIIGAATLLNPVSLTTEMSEVRGIGLPVSEENLLISSQAHLVLPHHVSADEISEAGKHADGSTKSGIRFVAADKYGRIGIRAESINNHYDELMKRVIKGLSVQVDARKKAKLEPNNIDELAEQFSESIIEIRDLITDTSYYVGSRLQDGATLLAEGAQGFLLDIDQGMYPFTTSSTTTAGGATTLGFGPTMVGQTLGVFKAIPSHVGGGPFITKIYDEEILDRLDPDPTAVDGETGKTTGRKRDLGAQDLAQIRRAVMANSPTSLALTKLDRVPRYGDSIPIVPNHRRKGKDYKVAADAAYKLEQSEPAEPIYLPNWKEDEVTSVRNYDDLPENARNYIEFLEEELKTPISMIGVGPDREQVIVR